MSHDSVAKAFAYAKATGLAIILCSFCRPTPEQGGAS